MSGARRTNWSAACRRPSAAPRRRSATKSPRSELPGMQATRCAHIVRLPESMPPQARISLPMKKPLLLGFGALLLLLALDAGMSLHTAARLRTSQSRIVEVAGIRIELRALLAAYV